MQNRCEHFWGSTLCSPPSIPTSITSMKCLKRQELSGLLLRLEIFLFFFFGGLRTANRKSNNFFDLPSCISFQESKLARALSPTQWAILYLYGPVSSWSLEGTRLRAISVSNIFGHDRSSYPSLYTRIVHSSRGGTWYACYVTRFEFVEDRNTFITMIYP